MNHTMPVERIRSEAERFRRAIQAAIAEAGLADVLDAFRTFPKGSCGKASAMLCNHLERQGLGPWGLVSGHQSQGESGEGLRTHAWAALDGVALDITGSQFPGRPEIWLGEPDDWFTQWEAGRPSAPYWEFDPKTKLGEAWDLVSQRL
ncbi:hypothetical protein [Streptomyces sp. NPDC005732]|uniref:hypothetical protein n=1 Tax=Streptomyces sp. NPDC005732 TaxID=3157057 RepID=UPI0033E8755A